MVYNSFFQFDPLHSDDSHYASTWIGISPNLIRVTITLQPYTLTGDNTYSKEECRMKV